MEYFEPSTYGLQNAGRPWSVTATGSDVRFEVRAGDRWASDASNKERSEVASFKKLAFGETHYISYKMMIEPGAANTAGWMLLGQVHQSEDAADMDVSPPFAIQMVGEKLQIVARADAARTTTYWPADKILYTSPTDIVRGQWYQIDLALRFNPSGQGEVQASINGVKVASYVGPVGYNDALAPYWKEGIYRDPSSETIAVHFANLSVSSASSPLNTATIGGALNDLLGGTLGADAFAGGAGNDTYYVDNVLDKVTELAGAGTDTIQTIVNYTLPTNVENLVLTGLAATDGAGNALGNTITGNEAANGIGGAEGNDVIRSNGGDDRIWGSEGADYIQAGAGNDLIVGGAGADQVYGGAGADTFRFESLNDFAKTSQQDVISDFSRAQGDKIDLSAIDANTLVAGDQAFTFIGTSGFHRVAGELNYAVAAGYLLLQGDVNGDGVADFQLRVYNTTNLLASDVIDTVQSSTGSTPPTGSTGTGSTTGGTTTGGTTGGGVTMQGDAGANSFSGSAGNDVLYGYGGNDNLNGAAGADQMYGGAGDDSYLVDNVGDRVIELAGEGSDLVKSSVTYTLPDNVEHLYLNGTSAINGTGNALANSINGNDAANVLNGLGGDDVIKGYGGADTLYGGDGSDTLTGGAGNDVLYGGAGGDVYYLDDAGDRVVEYANQGVDWINTLVSHVMEDNVENMSLLGAAAIDGTGNALDNILNGNNAANTISGGAGADTIKGNGGDDLLMGDAGADYISGGDGRDVIQGGAGGDTVYGGAGADVFVFRSLSEFAGTADLVGDFTRAQGDKIDLAGIDANGVAAGDQAFTFIGAQAFTGAAGELNYAKAAGGAVLVSGDINGDKLADFSFLVSGSTLYQSDFLL